MSAAQTPDGGDQFCAEGACNADLFAEESTKGNRREGRLESADSVVSASGRLYDVQFDAGKPFAA